MNEKLSLPKAIALLIGAGALVWWFWGGGWIQTADHQMQQVSDKVATDMVQQYEIAKRNGSKMDICTQAMMVTAGYLQAKNEPEYAKWKATQAADCKAAGVPTP